MIKIKKTQTITKESLEERGFVRQTNCEDSILFINEEKEKMVIWKSSTSTIVNIYDYTPQTS